MKWLKKFESLNATKEPTSWEGWKVYERPYQAYKGDRINKLKKTIHKASYLYETAHDLKWQKSSAEEVDRMTSKYDLATFNQDELNFIYDFKRKLQKKMKSLYPDDKLTIKNYKENYYYMGWSRWEEIKMALEKEDSTQAIIIQMEEVLGIDIEKRDDDWYIIMLDYHYTDVTEWYILDQMEQVTQFLKEKFLQ